MSCDFTLFELEADKDLDAALDEIEQRTPGKRKIPLSDSKARHHSIVQALIQHNPQLDWRPFAFAEVEGIEVDADENSNGIQINLFTSLHSDEIGITVPYWYDESQPRPIFAEIWDYLKIIEPMTGFVIYDPQLGRLLDLEKDLDVVVQVYCNGTNMVNNFIANAHG